MKKNDLILIALIAMIAALALTGVKVYEKVTTSDNCKAVVYIDGRYHSEYSLKADTEKRFEFENGNYNILVIKDGKADITAASCPDHICVDHRKVNQNGQTIVCLPNRLVVRIENDEEPELDGSVG